MIQTGCGMFPCECDDREEGFGRGFCTEEEEGMESTEKSRSRGFLWWGGLWFHGWVRA